MRWCASQFRHIWHGRALSDLLSRVQCALPVPLRLEVSALWLRLAQISHAAANPLAPFDADLWEQQLSRLDQLEQEEPVVVNPEVRASLAAELDSVCAYLDGLLLLLTSLRDTRPMCELIVDEGDSIVGPFGSECIFVFRSGVARWWQNARNGAHCWANGCITCELSFSSYASPCPRCLRMSS